jgi:transglutaminase-like putative cysteine protease
MTFDLVHKVVLYLAVSIGLLPLATSGEIDLLFVVAAYGAMAASWFYEPPRQRVATHTKRWTMATFAAMLVLAVLGWSSGRYLLYAILFALLMVVTRFFQSRGSRDTFQLYGLSFVVMVAGAVINPSLSFIGIFVIYLVLLVWGLILLHLQRDLEALQAEQIEVGERAADLLWRARDLVTARFLLGSSALALTIFACSLLIFVFFPRLGMGFFFSQGRAGQPVSGFADRIQLGHFGTIKDDMRVVMRVEFPEDREVQDRTLRMRGISFDTYDGRMWTKTTEETFELPRQTLGTWAVLSDTAGGSYRPGSMVNQTVYLEPLEMDKRMIFGEPSLRTFSIDNPELDRLRRHPVRFYRDAAGDISTSGPSGTALRYHVSSFVRGDDAQLLRQATGTITPDIEHLYLQLPKRLEAAVGALGREVTKAHPSSYDKAVAIERYLRREYLYSTEGGHDTSRPLEDFLFDRKAGHCEYFSTAMVVLLRTLGIPARPANGFYGGDYNEFGRFYAIRQADAHSWVEAHFPGHGWVTFDPTPPGSVLIPGGEGVFSSVGEWVDSLRLQWFKWVVEYDLEKQLSFFRAIGEQLGSLKDALPQPEGNPRQGSSWKKGFKTWLNDPGTWVMLGSPLVLAMLWRFGIFGWLWRLLRRRRRRETLPGAAGQLYHAMLLSLVRQGVGRFPQETPRELAARLDRSGYPRGEAIQRLTRAFEAERYADAPPSVETVGTLEGDLRVIRQVSRGDL